MIIHPHGGAFRAAGRFQHARRREIARDRLDQPHRNAGTRGRFDVMLVRLIGYAHEDGQRPFAEQPLDVVSRDDGDRRVRSKLRRRQRRALRRIGAPRRAPCGQHDFARPAVTVEPGEDAAEHDARAVRVADDVRAAADNHDAIRRAHSSIQFRQGHRGPAGPPARDPSRTRLRSRRGRGDSGPPA